MKKNTVLVGVATLALMLTGCSTLDQNYAYVVDQELVNKAENSQRQHRQVAHVVWVNPPLKKVSSADLPKP